MTHRERAPWEAYIYRWITNGTFADYFTVACKTEVSHFYCHLRVLSIVQGGYTVILVPRGENLETKAIKTTYSSTAGTAFVTFDKVRVPISNTLGKVGKGMQVILSNFNHEVIVYYPVASAADIS